ncbi:MAG: FMN-binding protein [Raoultibacter sp.]
MKKTAIAVCGAAVLAFGLSGCGSMFEGSGSKEAATPEQLALHEPDPWAQEIKASRQFVEQPCKDGVYTGTGVGMDGKITATLLIKDNHLTCLETTQDGESQSVGGYEAIRDGKFAAMIDAAQGSDIDTITGATITTSGVKEAVVDAMAQAKAERGSDEHNTR